MHPDQKTSVPTILIIFGTIYLYGLERGVIEIFDLLRPNVTPLFLISRTAQRLNLPVFAEIKRRNFHYTFLSDHEGWVRLGKPKSPRMLWLMLVAFIKANRDALKAAWHTDILYLPNIFAFYNAIATCVFFRFRKKQIIYHFHDLKSTHSASLRFATFFITDFIHNSQLSYQAVLRDTPYIQKRNNNIIPYPIGKRTSANRDQILQRQFDGKRNILFIGQVSKHKGIDLLVKAMKWVAASYSDVALHIIGECKDQDFENELQRLCDDAQCEVRRWGYRDDVLHLLEKTYIYVQPSPPSIFNESFGIGTLEAMSIGVPTV
jgi:glycosyltransferase involved in cell wall biosynthesis